MKVRIGIPATVVVECDVDDMEDCDIRDAAIDAYQNGDYTVGIDEDTRGWAMVPVEEER